MTAWSDACLDLEGAHELRMEILFVLLPLATQDLFVLNSFCLALHVYIIVLHGFVV